MGFFSDLKLSVKLAPMVAQTDASIKKLERLLADKDYLGIIDYLPAADLMMKRQHEQYILLRGKYGAEALLTPSLRLIRYTEKMIALMAQAEQIVAPLRDALHHDRPNPT